MININIVIFILMNIVLYFSLTYLLNIYQQSHYDFKKLTKSFRSFYLTKPYMILSYISIVSLLINNIYVLIILMILYFALILYKPKYIIKLKYTNRIYRIIITTLLLVYIVLIITKLNTLVFSILNISIPLIIYIAVIINYPVEKLKKRYYIKKAKEKLLNNKNLLKIAITGSYGKTSTKHILYEVLKDYAVTVCTPESYNTILGLCTTINNNVTNQTEVLIVEMGTNHLGEIKEMCKLIEPHIGVITEIGPQHLSTLKSMKNILKAKLEISSHMTYDDVLIINGDNTYLENIKPINIENIYKAGKKETNNYIVRNINIDVSNQYFDIYHNNKLKTKIETKLLGEHNINNIILIYAVIDNIRNYIDIKDEIFSRLIKDIIPFNHRLKYKKQNNLHIFDDSYNSNINGFKNAIKVMSKQLTKKIIITPGIVDNGSDEKRINEEIALTLINEMDEIYLIKNPVIKYYQNIFDEVRKEYIVFNSFKEAYIYLICNHQKEEVSVLFENDLPDCYLER